MLLLFFFFFHVLGYDSSLLLFLTEVYLTEADQMTDSFVS